MNRKKIVTGLLCMAGLLPVCAQQRVLSVDEMFRLADTNSRSIRSHRLAVDETKQGIKTAKSDKLPSIEANLSFSYIGNGWMTDLTGRRPLCHITGIISRLKRHRWYMPGELSTVVFS